MLLAVDAGNTHTVFGLFEGSRLQADWRIATRKEITADELGVLLMALFDRCDVEPSRVDVIRSCNVPISVPKVG